MGQGVWGVGALVNHPDSLWSETNSCKSFLHECEAEKLISAGWAAAFSQFLLNFLLIIIIISMLLSEPPVV